MSVVEDNEVGDPQGSVLLAMRACLLVPSLYSRVDGQWFSSDLVGSVKRWVVSLISHTAARKSSDKVISCLYNLWISLPP